MTWRALSARPYSKAKALNTQLGEEKARADAAAARAASADAAMAAVAAPGQDENTAVDMLREDAEQAEAEATLCLDRERMLALEVGWCRLKPVATS